MNLGLTEAEAQQKLKTEGYNSLPQSKDTRFYHILFGIFTEPMFGLLLAASIIYIFIGDFTEALIVSVFALLSVTIAVFQEWRSEKVLEKLRDLSSPRALVLRDGVQKRIPGNEVVRGDLIYISEGDRIPADANIAYGSSLLVDESLLTGESIPVEKKSDNGYSEVFSGSLVLRGHGQAIVTKTGSNSEIGKIGSSLKEIKSTQSSLKMEMARIIKLFAFLAISLSLISVLLYGILRDKWLEGSLNGIAIGMSLLPEEFPLILVVFMSMGAWRISRANVLTRKASSIEALGSMTVLCTDKTGTLTENKMVIRHLKTLDQDWDGSDLNKRQSQDILYLLEAGRKASNQDSLDSMDLSFYTINSCPLHPDHWYSITPEILMTAGVYKDQEGYKVFAKGAPETIWQACSLNAENINFWRNEVESLASQGLRVLAVAKARFSSSALPENANQFNYQFLGLIGFADPVRKDVPAAVRKCRAAGIRVIMITGDYPATAENIAFQIGLNSQNILTGPDIDSFDDPQLSERIKTTSIFARIKPEQKLRIVRALQANGEIVAMTGDGVNDAPSIKAADIGVAMGGRGTDVAREASSIVLLDNNFASLVKTISLGRRIYDNLRKAMVYICAIHVPITVLAILPLILNLPIILTPLIIALIEMCIDPVCSVILEAEREEDDVMNRPPRDPKASILPWPLFAWGIVQGGISILLLAISWHFQRGAYESEDLIRSFVLINIFVINIALILANRSFSPSLKKAVIVDNQSFIWCLLGASIIFYTIFSWDSSREILKLGTLDVLNVGSAGLLGLCLFTILESAKYAFVRYGKIGLYKKMARDYPAIF